MQIVICFIYCSRLFDIGQNISEISKTLEKVTASGWLLVFQVIGFPRFQSEEIQHRMH